MAVAARTSVGSVRQRDRRQPTRIAVTGAIRLAGLLQRLAVRGPVVASAGYPGITSRHEPLTRP